MTPYHLLPSTSILVAVKSNKVLATVSLTLDSEFGTPSCEIFKNWRNEFNSLGEISSLAIDKAYRSQTSQLFLPLLRRLWQHVVYELQISHCIIAHDPKWELFYKNVFLFEKVEGVFVDKYKFANSAPAMFQV